MRKLLTVGLLASIWLHPGVASATSVSMTLTGVGSGNSLGPAYIGPYVATIDGVKDFQVICDDFIAESFLTESWHATTNTLAGVIASPAALNTTKFKDVTGYEEIAWLASKLVAQPASACTNNPANCTGDIQYAIWQVFDHTGSTTPFSYLSGNNQSNAIDWLSQAQAAVAAPGFDPSYYHLTIYTPTSCISNCNDGKLPQEFITIKTPEPATMPLLGLGLFGLLCVGARQRSASNPDFRS